MSIASQDLIAMQKTTKGGMKFRTLDDEGLRRQDLEIRNARRDIIRNRKKVSGSRYPRRGPAKQNHPIRAWEDEPTTLDLTLKSVEAAEIDAEMERQAQYLNEGDEKPVKKKVPSSFEANKKALLEDIRALRQEQELNFKYLAAVYKEMEHEEDLIGTNNSPKNTKPRRNLRAELLQNLVRTREHENTILENVMKRTTLEDVEALDEILAENKSEITQFVNEKREKYLPNSYIDDQPEEKSQNKKKVKAPRGFVRQEARSILTDHRQKLIEEVSNKRRLKELEDELEMKKRFTAKPIPPSTTEPRYKQLIELDNARRLSNHIARKERLQHDERPFEGMIRRERERAIKRAAKESERQRKKEEEEEIRAQKRQDRINKAMSYGSSGGFSYQQMKEENDAKRKARMAKRSDALRKSAHMPARMEMHLLEEQHKKQQEKAAIQRARQLEDRHRKKKSKKYNFNRTQSLSEIRAKQEVRRQMRRQERVEYWKSSSRLPGQMGVMEQARRDKRAEKERKMKQKKDQDLEEERLKKEKAKRESETLRSMAYSNIKVRTTAKVKAYNDHKAKLKLKEEEEKRKKELEKKRREKRKKDAWKSIKHKSLIERSIEDRKKQIARTRALKKVADLTQQSLAASGFHGGTMDSNFITDRIFTASEREELALAETMEKSS